ncbi:amino acid ABC transporter substrate-binding protein [Actinomycetes bacterium]|jgi:polar amino acid transport system substrate-binding protein|nr:amino acid ABC transporter substrate-binding protein [Actinomycetes bacterium]
MTTKSRFTRLAIILGSTAALGLASCGNDDSSSACPTIESGKLTIATGTPAFEPWVVGDAPESGEGFEAAVAYAVAGELGYSNENVVWVRTGFDEAIQPGAKNFDFNLQQYSITEERKATVSFSDPYYSTNQAVVGFADSPVASATKVSELKELKFGAQSGTTSLDFINNVIKPTNEPFVYDDNAGAKAALEAKQIDAIVVDLPTAFYISAVEIEGSKVIGQFPLSDAVAADNFGLLFDKDNKLVDCVNTALGALKESGKLAEIEKTWLADKTNAPVISLD